MIYKAGVLTISDRASEGIYEDKSGPVLRDLLTKFGIEAFDYKVIGDDFDLIIENLKDMADMGLHLIITTGGTGLSPRDVTPDATRAIIQKEIPGFGEAMRNEGSKITPMAYLSRAIAGIYNNTLIINFPGSAKACKENFAFIEDFLIHALDTINNNSNH